MNVPKPFTRKKSSTLLHENSDEKRCFNLEEIMQFEAARQRALACPIPESNLKPFSDFVPSRIFINHVDTFNGMHFVKYFASIKKVLEESGETENEYEDSKNNNNAFAVDDYNFTEDKYEDDVSKTDEDKESTSKRKISSVYEILGTLEFVNNPKYTKTEDTLELVDNEKKTEFLEKVLSCGFIIYDITNVLCCHSKQIEEAKWVAESIHKRLENLEKNQPRAFSQYKDCRTFILVSTLLTWSKTKPLDPDDLTLPFTERDFRKRKPHPNYKLHCELEKKIIELGKKYPNHLRTIVIGTGIPYGHEEDVFHFCFKMAWMVEPSLPIFGKGKNILPVIHIDTLSSILHSVISSFPKKYFYLVATDPQSITLKQVVKLLAKKLGSGKTVIVNREEALLYPDMKQKTYDMLTANINIVPGYVMDKPTIVWATDRPLAENLDKIIEEFKRTRGLLPVKIFIHGPPASGKSFLSKRLASYYDIPHLHVKGVIEDTIQNLKDKIEILSKKNNIDRENDIGEKNENEDGGEDEEEDDDNEEEEGENLDTLIENLKDIELNMKNEKQRLDEEFVIKFFKDKMLSNLCQNKGYVIDGYPKTIDYTRMLYEVGEEGEERVEVESEGQGDVSHLCNLSIMPAYVESLDASDEFLIERVIKMPETDFQSSHYEEPEMCRRLAQFRAWNTEDNTPLIYYDELEVHPMIYNIENDLDPKMEPTFQAIISRVGPPRNYGKKESGIEEIIMEEKIRQRQQHHDELKVHKEEIRKAAQEKRDNLKQWMLLKNQELEMEEKALLVMGLPLRHYLMKYIFPTLTRGLVEVARLRPEDPVDFLSEFLFRENPEGKMFQPNFEEREEKLEKALKEYETSLNSKDFSRRNTFSRSYSTDKSPKSDAISKISSYKCSFISTGSKKVSTKLSSPSIKSKYSKSNFSGTCTCQKSPSLSTCSSDVSPSTPVSCTCTFQESRDY